MKLLLVLVLVYVMLLVVAVSNFGHWTDQPARQNESAKVGSIQTKLIIFVRFHAREGKEAAVEAELRDAAALVSKEFSRLRQWVALASCSPQSCYQRLS